MRGRKQSNSGGATQWRTTAAILSALLFALAVPRAWADARTQVLAPTIETVIIENGGESQIEGEGRPGEVVELVSDGAALGEAIVSGNGRWRITLQSGLRPGIYEIRADAREGQLGTRRAGDEIRLSIPAELAGRAVVAYDAGKEQDQATRARAEKLADAAGRAYDEVTARPAGDPAQAQTGDTGASKAAADTESQSGAEASDASQTGALSLVVEWLKRSARGYREDVINRLAERTAPAQSTAPAPTPAIEPGVAAETIARERAEAAARRTEIAEADAARKSAADEKAKAEQAAKDAAKRKQADELARRKADSDKRIADELERLKKAKEEADRAKAQKTPGAQAAAPASKAAITLERFYLPGEKRPTQSEERKAAELSDAKEGDDGPDTARAASHCATGKVFTRNGRRWYRTGTSDTLWDIAEKFYGSGLAYPRIYKVNRKRLASPHVVRPCLALRLPGRG